MIIDDSCATIMYPETSYSSLFRYRDDEDDLEGSAEEEDSYRERDGGGDNTHRLQEESINVVS